jgi:hypothetical protein
VETTSKGHWLTQLDDESARRRDQPSFHVFAEGQHSDVRGQIYNLAEGKEIALPYPGWVRHVFIVVGISGTIEAQVEGASHVLRAQSQLVLLPGVVCKLRARVASAIELLSFQSSAV